MENLFWLAAIIVLIYSDVFIIRDTKKANIAMKRRDENIERIADALENRKGE